MERLKSRSLDFALALGISAVALTADTLTFEALESAPAQTLVYSPDAIIMAAVTTGLAGIYIQRIFKHDETSNQGSET